MDCETQEGLFCDFPFSLLEDLYTEDVIADWRRRKEVQSWEI